MNARELKGLLAAYRIDCTDELTLQEGIARILTEHAVPFEREYRLGARDRPDFFVAGVAVECKVGGSVTELIRQLTRYAEHECVAELLVVTSRLRHNKTPVWLSEKRVTVLAMAVGL
jgi:hypothetical protein